MNIEITKENQKLLEDFFNTDCIQEFVNNVVFKELTYMVNVTEEYERELKGFEGRGIKKEYNKKRSL